MSGGVTLQATEKSATSAAAHAFPHRLMLKIRDLRKVVLKRVALKGMILTSHRLHRCSSVDDGRGQAGK
ncbi:hypothetical protein KKH3_36720 [Pectobacterium actinidiae]|nr:hypothetical protein KKH3_36720 [Pectobacterium actinidiae]